MKSHYLEIVNCLEPKITSVKSKEELATSMVRVLQRAGHAKDFLSDITMAEVGQGQSMVGVGQGYAKLLSDTTMTPVVIPGFFFHKVKKFI